MLAQKDCVFGESLRCTVPVLERGVTYAAVPHKGTVERLCLKLPEVSRVE